MSNVNEAGGVAEPVAVADDKGADESATTESGLDDHRLYDDYPSPTFLETLYNDLKWWARDPLRRWRPIPAEWGDWDERGRLVERLTSLQAAAEERDLIVSDSDDPVILALNDAARVRWGEPRTLARAKRTELVALETIRYRACKEPNQDDDWVVARIKARALEVKLQADLEQLTPADRREVTTLLDDGHPIEEYHRNISSALNILYRHHRNTSLEAVRGSILESQLRFFLLVVVLCLGALFIIWAYFFGEVGVSPTVSLFSTPFIGTVVLFGALGAAISSLMSLSSVLNNSAIPERVGSLWLACSRVIVGAASALILYVFVIAELVNVFVVTPSSLLAIAFVGGFTERLLVKAVNAVGGETDSIPSGDRRHPDAGHESSRERA